MIGGVAQSEERVLCKHEAPGSKPGISIYIYIFLIYIYIYIYVLVAQRIRRVTTNHEIAGSNPAEDDTNK